MGGRGASSGTSKAGNRYGSQYRTVISSGNIKIIDARHSGVETVVETMTRGRVYGVLNSKGNLGSIVYFDNENKRSKRIDLDHIHKKMIPHTQHGYMTGGNDGKKVRQTSLLMRRKWLSKSSDCGRIKSAGTSTNAHTSTPW